MLALVQSQLEMVEVSHRVGMPQTTFQKLCDSVSAKIIKHVRENALAEETGKAMLEALAASSLSKEYKESCAEAVAHKFLSAAQDGTGPASAGQAFSGHSGEPSWQPVTAAAAASEGLPPELGTKGQVHMFF